MKKENERSVIEALETIADALAERQQRKKIPEGLFCLELTKSQVAEIYGINRRMIGTIYRWMLPDMGEGKSKWTVQEVIDWNSADARTICERKAACREVRPEEPYMEKERDDE